MCWSSSSSPFSSSFSIDVRQIAQSPWQPAASGGCQSHWTCAPAGIREAGTRTCGPNKSWIKSTIICPTTYTTNTHAHDVGSTNSTLDGHARMSESE